MKKILAALKRSIPTLTACLAAVLLVEANTATCFIFHQPEAPKSLDRFKRIK